MSELVIKKRELSPDELEIALEGELSTETMPELQRAFEDALRGKQGKIALNLEGLERMGSAAIGRILQFKKRCDAEGRRLVIRGCRPETLSLFKMVKMDTLIDVEP